MAFVYEQFDEATGLDIKKKVSPYQMVMSTPLGQVIDRERGIFFLVLGGQGGLPPQYGEPPTYYALCWQGAWVVFEGYNNELRSETDVQTSFNLIRLCIPVALKGELESIEQAIRDAMQVYKEYSQKLSGLKVSTLIQFPSATYY